MAKVPPPPGTPGQKLTYAQLEAEWIDAGGPPALAAIAAAIAEAESGGNPNAVNPNDNNGAQSSYGLWQISNGTHQPPDPNWAIPGSNALLAVAKWQGAGKSFSPWGTYNSGAYKKFVNNSTTPDFGFGQGVSGTVSGTGGTAGPDCLVALPTLSIPSIGIGIGSVGGGSVGGGCMFTKSQARAFIGGFLIVAAFPLGLGGLLIAVAAGLRGTKAAGYTQGALAAVPGVGTVATVAGAAQGQRAPSQPASKPPAAPAPTSQSRAGTAPPRAPKRQSNPPGPPGQGPSKSGTAPPPNPKPKTP